jgi:hypothetical protein
MKDSLEGAVVKINTDLSPSKGQRQRSQSCDFLKSEPRLASVVNLVFQHCTGTSDVREYVRRDPRCLAASLRNCVESALLNGRICWTECNSLQRGFVIPESFTL